MRTIAAPRTAPRAALGLRRLSMREVLDIPVALIPLAGHLVLGVAAASVLTAGVVGGMVGAAVSVTDTRFVVVAIAVLVVSIPFRLVIAVATTVSVLDRLDGGRPQVGQVWRATRPLLWPAALLRLRTGTVAVVAVALSAVVCLLVPIGAVVAARVSARRFLALPAMVAEGVPAGLAVHRSAQLVAPNPMRVTMIRLATWSSVALLVPGALLLPSAMASLVGVSDVGWVTAGSVGWSALAAAGTTLLSCTRIVCYHDMSCRSEGADIVAGIPR